MTSCFEVRIRGGSEGLGQKGREQLKGSANVDSKETTKMAVGFGTKVLHRQEDVRAQLITQHSNNDVDKHLRGESRIQCDEDLLSKVALHRCHQSLIRT